MLGQRPPRGKEVTGVHNRQNLGGASVTPAKDVRSYREERTEKFEQFERVLPHISTTSLDRLLQSAHQVDGIVKGMKLPAWPTDNWQALLRLALMLSKACNAR